MKKEEIQKEKIRLLELCDYISKFNNFEINIERTLENFFYFVYNYLPHYFTNKKASFQKSIINILESDNKYIAIAAPRGFSKSTIVSFAYIIWSVIKKKYKFIIIVSATDEIADDISNCIKKEIETNLRIKRDFNIDIKSGSKGDFITKNNIRIISRGKRQALRGFRHNEHRPDLIILDDIEKDEEASSSCVVRKTLLLIFKSLVPSLSPNGKIIIIGTIIQKNCCLDHIINRSYWKTLRLSALTMDKDGIERSIWENRFSTKFLQEKKRAMGNLEFNTEYQNLSSYTDNNAIFTESMIVVGESENKRSVLFIDPSVGGNKGDFKCCIMVRGCISKIEIHTAIFEKLSDHIFFTKIMELYKNNEKDILAVGIESNGFQKYFINEFSYFMRTNNMILPIKMIHNSLKKEIRIMKLLQFFESKKIVFNETFILSEAGDIFKEQLLRFPDKKINDDGPDALSSGIDLLLNMNNKNKDNTLSNITQIPSLRKKKFMY